MRTLAEYNTDLDRHSKGTCGEMIQRVSARSLRTWTCKVVDVVSRLTGIKQSRGAWPERAQSKFKLHFPILQRIYTTKGRKNF